MDKMKTKFAKTFSASHNEIKESRANMLSEEVSLEVDSFVGDLKKEMISLKNKLVRLTDLSPDSADSLRPTSKDFNPTLWVKELHKTKMDIKLKKIELEEAEAIEKEWFSVDDESNYKSE